MADPFKQFGKKSNLLDTPVTDPGVPPGVGSRKPTLDPLGVPNTNTTASPASLGPSMPGDDQQQLTLYEGAPPITQARLLAALRSMEGLDFYSASQAAGSDQDKAIALNYLRTVKPDLFGAHPSENNYGFGPGNTVIASTPRVSAGPDGWNAIVSRTMSTPAPSGPITAGPIFASGAGQPTPPDQTGQTNPANPASQATPWSQFSGTSAQLPPSTNPNPDPWGMNPGTAMKAPPASPQGTPWNAFSGGPVQSGAKPEQAPAPVQQSPWASFAANNRQPRSQAGQAGQVSQARGLGSSSWWG